MHEMQTVVTDVHGVCQSVLQSVCLSVWSEHSWGPIKHCVSWGF